MTEAAASVSVACVTVGPVFSSDPELTELVSGSKFSSITKLTCFQSILHLIPLTSSFSGVHFNETPCEQFSLTLTLVYSFGATEFN